MPRTYWLFSLLLLSGCATLAARQARQQPSGSGHQVRRDGTTAYTGKVYLFRGGAAGVFSTGLNRWSRQLTDIGVPNEIGSHLTWQSCCDRMMDAAGQPRGPIILVGHSYGADAAIQAAQKLDECHVAVDLLLTLDPTKPVAVPKNVRRALNFYMSNSFWDKTPIWHGVPLQAEIQQTKLENVHLQSDRDLNLPGLSHANLDDNPIIQQEAIRQILRTFQR